jgi:hypothetical protein
MKFLSDIGVAIVTDPRVKAAVQSLLTSDETRAFVEDLLASEKVQAAGEALLGRVITKQIVPLIPVAAGTAAAAAIEQALKRFPGVDDAIETTVDTVESIQGAQHALDGLLPDIDFGGPVDAILDFWRPR